MIYLRKVLIYNAIINALIVVCFCLYYSLLEILVSDIGMLFSGDGGSYTFGQRCCCSSNQFGELMLVIEEIAF